MDILSTLAGLASGLALAISSFLFPAPAPEPALGAALPSATAVFETALAAPISSSATSLTLTANAVRGGGSLAGYTCFTIDEGSSQAEFACGTVSGTSVTGLLRGVSPMTGTTTDTDLQFSHRRGASVKITDFPLIQVLKAQANGEDTFPNILNYASHPTFVANTNIVDKKYVDDIAFSGAAVVDATNAARGVVELATPAEQAASAATGGAGPLVLAAANATSTRNSATAANVVPVTGVTGLIDPGFVFNGVPLTFPATHGASSTALLTNGSGVMTWNGITTALFASSSPVSRLSGGAASTTVYAATIPANTLSTGNSIRVKLQGVSIRPAGTNSMFIEAGFGNSTTSVKIGNLGAPNGRGEFEYVITSAGTTNSQRAMIRALTFSDSNIPDYFSTSTMATSSGAVDSTASQFLTIVIGTLGGNDVFSTWLATTEILRF